MTKIKQLLRHDARLSGRHALPEVRVAPHVLRLLLGTAGRRPPAGAPPFPAAADARRQLVGCRALVGRPILGGPRRGLRRKPASAVLRDHIVPRMLHAATPSLTLLNGID